MDFNGLGWWENLLNNSSQKYYLFIYWLQAHFWEVAAGKECLITVPKLHWQSDDSRQMVFLQRSHDGHVTVTWHQRFFPPLFCKMMRRKHLKAFSLLIFLRLWFEFPLWCEVPQQHLPDRFLYFSRISYRKHPRSPRGEKWGKCIIIPIYINRQRWFSITKSKYMNP